MDDQFRNNLKSSVASLSNTARGIDEANLKATLENINEFTRMLSESSGKISATFGNLQSISDTIQAADLYGSISSLKNSLEKTSDLLENLNKGKGTAGQLLTNDSLYINLNGSINSLDLLLQDLKANPKRYVHFSLFGKKNIPAK
jgi:phospholipid/cholesterol/gamma-HCH transport system substrate-binding protein